MKLQGKLKALVVVGVNLEHLGVELSPREKELLKPAVEAVGRGTVTPPLDPLLYVLRVCVLFLGGQVDCRITCVGWGQESQGEVGDINWIA